MGFGQQLIRKLASSFLFMKHISCFLDPLQNNTPSLFEFFHFKFPSFAPLFTFLICNNIFKNSILVHIFFDPLNSRIPTHLPFAGKNSLVMDPSIVKFFEEDEVSLYLFFPFVLDISCLHYLWNL